MKKKKSIGPTGIWHVRYPAQQASCPRLMAIQAYGCTGIWPCRHLAPTYSPRHTAIQAYGPTGIRACWHTSPQAYIPTSMQPCWHMAIQAFHHAGIQPWPAYGFQGIRHKKLSRYRNYINGSIFADSWGPMNLDHPIHCMCSLNWTIWYAVVFLCGNLTVEQEMWWNILWRLLVMSDGENAPWFLYAFIATAQRVQAMQNPSAWPVQPNNGWLTWDQKKKKECMNNHSYYAL